MKIYKLLLQADTRGNRITYKEFIGHKVFLREPAEQTRLAKVPNPKWGEEDITETRHIQKQFIKSVSLFDEDTKKYRKQKVWLRVIDYNKHIAIVEVF